MRATLTLFLLSCIGALAFRGNMLSTRLSTRRYAEDDAAFEELRKKMEANPNYNPMTDPQAQQVSILH